MAVNKIVIIGAGSTEFTPGLLADLVTSPNLRSLEVALVDIDATTVDTMTRLAQRMSDAKGAALKISGTTDRREALLGADIVTTTIAVGGARTWEADVRLSERYGIWQTVGDSVGPGGVFRALRHVHEIVAIAKDMEELCPDAWLFNYTNPLSAIVRGVHKATSIKCAGLCHGVLHTRHLIARDLGLPAQEVQPVFAGVNHLCWLLDLRHNGEDVYPAYQEWLKRGRQDWADSEDADAYDSFQYVSAWLTEIYGRFPSPGDRHVSEFFSYFLRPDAATGRLPYGTQHGLDQTNSIFAAKESTREYLRAQADGREPLDEELFADAREGERLIHIIEAMSSGQPLYELAVNLRNDGLIANLPEWAVVEVPGVVTGGHIRGMGVGSLPEGIAGLLQHRVLQQELTVDAALTGDRGLALQALLADPLVQNIGIEAVEAMLDESLDANARFLPQFAAARALAER
jgi:alpha-galactosidase